MGRHGGRALRAAVIVNGRLELEDSPSPTPRQDQVLVRMVSSAVNRADLLQREGGYTAPDGWPPDVPGLEFAGVVKEVGEAVRSPRPGDEVMGIVGGGAHATYLLTLASLCVPVPAEIDIAEAGCIPEAFITAHDALVSRGRVRSGERVLVHGVGSGVGTAVVQIARVLGARTVGTSRTPEKLDRAKALGLDEGILTGDDMVDRIGEVDVVIDLIGGHLFEANVAACSPRGRIVIVGLVAGSQARLDMGAVLTKRLEIIGTILRTRPEREKVQATRAFAEMVLPYLASGEIRPVVEARFSLNDIEKAYELIASNRTFGKVLILPEI